MSTEVNLIPEAGKTASQNVPEKEPQKCCGRQITLCNCMSSEKLFIISAIIGTALLIVGIAALVGAFGPQSTALSNALNCVAAKLGSDAATLAMFTAAFGFGFALTGVVGATIEHRKEPQSV